MKRDRYHFRKKDKRTRIWGERFFWLVSLAGSVLLVIFWLDATIGEQADDGAGSTVKIGSVKQTTGPIYPAG